ncbi:radical SAM protein [Desulfonatronospira sp.]|uniref:radical SAM protein n=1 Tax=Desulfonatronospira sp. TaxID=1962951 RepID=UPI0025BD3F13|nr:radical SAM protein [Desulfonatronospira sp.]
MNLEQLIKLRSSFYKTVLLFVTRKCPLKCKHCSVEAGPEYNESIPLFVVDSWMRGIRETKTVELINISGGEPFTNIDLLKKILSAAENYGMKVVVGTSGFWASNPVNAKRVIESLPLFTVLQISADEFHEKFVPIERIKHATIAALEKNINIVITFVNNNNISFKDRFYKLMGDNLIREIEFLEINLRAMGRAAKNNLVIDRHTHDLPEGACDRLNAPVVKYDGNVMACCHDELIPRSNHFLWLGNLHKVNFNEIYQKANHDFLIQALRTIGPKGIIDIITKESWEWKPRTYKENNICDLCKDIVFSPYLISMFQEYAKDLVFQHETTIKRFFKYGEAMQV